MILGIDPGLGTFGWARVDGGRVDSLGLLESKPTKTKDYEHRAAKQAAVVVDQLADVTLVAAESLSFPRRGRAGAISLCLSWGVIDGACVARAIPVVRTRPQQWQHACLGDGQGKGRVDYPTLVRDLERYVRLHGTQRAVEQLEQIPPSKRSHPLDGLGVALWALVRADGVERVGSQPAVIKRSRRPGRGA